MPPVRFAVKKSNGRLSQVMVKLEKAPESLGGCVNDPVPSIVIPFESMNVIV